MEEDGLCGSLPKAGENKEEDADLGEQDDGPVARLGEMVEGRDEEEACDEEAQGGEENEGGVGQGQVATEGAERGAEGGADAAVWAAGRAQRSGEGDGVDFDEIEEEAEEAGGEEDDEVTKLHEDEGGLTCRHFVNVFGPGGLGCAEDAEDDGRGEEGEERVMRRKLQKDWRPVWKRPLSGREARV